MVTKLKFGSLSLPRLMGFFGLLISFSFIFIIKVNALTFGSGLDGSATLTSSININTQSIGASTDRNGSTADGVVYRVNNISSNVITTAQTISGILANDLILLINLQGTASNYSSVGNYEILTVSSVTGNSVSLSSAPSLNYVNGDSYSNQKVIIQRIPQYSSLTINNGGSITATIFDSLSTLSSGIVTFAVNGTLTINSGGSINISGKGYQGGAGLSGNGTQGSSYNGNGSRTNTPLGGGGGGGISHYYAYGITSGGAGGGYSVAGSNGVYGSGYPTSAPGTGGGTYGIANLSKIYLGSGGGGGASYSDNGDSPGANGSAGGGAILLMTNSINVVGSINAIGATGGSALGSWGSGGGGGAGGSILIQSQSAALGSNVVIAYGGSGGSSGGGAGAGGAGGAGRIAVQYSSSITGTTNPSANTLQLDLTAPTFQSITGSSTTWYNTVRYAVITASDAGGAGLAEIRYNWGSNVMNSTCSSGGTVISNGGTTSASPLGNISLYVCARDNSGNHFATSQADYRWENTPPTGPSSVSASYTGSHYVNTSFNITMNGTLSDTGGSGLKSAPQYRICRSADNSTGCSVWVSGYVNSTYTISGSDLPPNGSYRYYYGYTVDNAGNYSAMSTGDYVTMDTSAPTTTSIIDEPEFTVGTSNTVNSEISTDLGVNGIEYEFCENSVNSTSGCTSSGWLSNPEATFNGLIPGNTYYYFVRSRDSLLNTNSWSSSKNSTQVDTTPTPTPTYTPTPTFTPTPTETPTPIPTDTPTPTPTVTITLPSPSTTPIPGGTTVRNVASGIILVLNTDWNTNLETTAQTGNVKVGVEDSVHTNIKVAEMEVNFNTSPDWSGVSGATDENISYFHSNNPITTITNGAASSYTLYVRKGEGDKVLICPGATSLLEVSLTCPGGYYLSEGETKNGATASVVMNEIAYWKISGLTSTGGMSVLTGLKDTLSRLQVSSPSDHKITFGTSYGMITGSTDSMIISFPNFDLTGLTLSDIELTDSVGLSRTLAVLPGVNTWGVIIDNGAKTITFSVPTSGTGGYSSPDQIVIKVGQNAGGTNQITNPSFIGNTTISITLNNTAPGEIGEVNIPIIDSDSVTITSYVNAYLAFDIDTGVGEVPGIDPIQDCTFNSCLTHQNGDPGLNYTVDLGELTSALVNKSNGTSVSHSSGGNGIINSIYFDVSTNAPAGAVVTVKSANGGLQGPGTNKIPFIGVETGADGIVRSDGDDIPANSGIYGFNLPVSATQILGSIIPNSLCNSLVKFCGADSITPKTVFTTNNLPVDTARVRMDLAAAANYTNNPGLYTDTLTFVATSTF